MISGLRSPLQLTHHYWLVFDSLLLTVLTSRIAVLFSNLPSLIRLVDDIIPMDSDLPLAFTACLMGDMNTKANGEHEGLARQWRHWYWDGIIGQRWTRGARQAVTSLVLRWHHWPTVNTRGSPGSDVTGTEMASLTVNWQMTEWCSSLNRCVLSWLPWRSVVSVNALKRGEIQGQ